MITILRIDLLVFFIPKTLPVLHPISCNELITISIMRAYWDLLIVSRFQCTSPSSQYDNRNEGEKKEF
jgi:hypothetical protein